MKIFGIALTVLGVLACLSAILMAVNITNTDVMGSAAIAAAIAGVGIVGAAAVILRHS